MSFTNYAIVFCCALLLQSTTSSAQGNRVEQDCVRSSQDCSSARDCTPTMKIVKREDCSVCLLSRPWGGCAARGNDPYCEARNAAAKAAAEIEASSNKADCERIKAQEKATCELQKELAKRLCEAGDRTNSLDKLLSEKGTSIPGEIVDKIVNTKFYERSFLDKLSVKTEVPKEDIPTAFRTAEVGFTIGTIIFVLQGQTTNRLPLRFWLTQVEFAKFYAEYGLERFYQVLSNDAGRDTMAKLINGKVDSMCASLSGEITCDK